VTTYFAAAWHHDEPDDPIFMWHELDDARNEVRKVEEFRDGVRLRADAAHPDGETGLSEKPLADLADIEGQAEFTVHALTAEEFDQVWQAATYSR
jgi:hypothetical protein